MTNDKYAGGMPDNFFRTLDDKEAEEFRAWTRANYQPFGMVNPAWHPIVRDECRKIDSEELES